MNHLLESIRTATAPDATSDMRQAGVTACRTILAALEASAGQAMTASPPVDTSQIANLVGMLRGVPADQLLDLAISKLRAALPTGVEVPRIEPLKFRIIPLPHMKR